MKFFLYINATIFPGLFRYIHSILLNRVDAITKYRHIVLKLLSFSGAQKVLDVRNTLKVLDKQIWTSAEIGICLRSCFVGCAGWMFTHASSCIRKAVLYDPAQGYETKFHLKGTSFLKCLTRYYSIPFFSRNVE